MASLDGVQTRYFLRTGTVQQVSADTPVAIRLRYIGTGLVTSVTVTTATNIVTVSTEGTKTYTFATYTTVGTLVGAINADGIFQAKVLDALNADVTTGSNFVTGAITAGTDANGVVSWDVKVDTSVNLAVTATLTGNRDWDTNWFNAEKVGQHRAVLQSIFYLADVNAASANSVRVYRRRGTPGRTETQILGIASVDNTATTVSFASGVGFISGYDGDELVVRVQDATSISDTGLVLEAIGYIE